jgi:dihydroneopterin aldolase
MSGDRILIEGLSLDTMIGVYPWERQLQQQLILDLELAVDVTRAARADQLEDALDYAAVVQWLEQQLQQTTYQLIETLAERLAQGLLRDFSLQGLTLTIRKPGALAQARSVAVRITRGDLD